MAVDVLIACVVMLASADADSTVPPRMGRSTRRGLYLLVEDVGAIFAAVVDAGATGCSHRRRPSGALSALASSIPRAMSGRSAPASPAAIGEDSRRSPLSGRVIGVSPCGGWAGALYPRRLRARPGSTFRAAAR
jgi:hypothetical protein